MSRHDYPVTHPHVTELHKSVTVGLSGCMKFLRKHSDCLLNAGALGSPEDPVPRAAAVAATRDDLGRGAAPRRDD